MASTLNPFDLLIDNDTDDLTELVKVSVVHEKKVSLAAAAVAAPKPAAAKLPSKPLPPSQAVREARSDVVRGGGRRGGRGRESRDHGERASAFNGYSGGYTKPSDERDSEKNLERRGGYGGPRGSFRGGRGGGGFVDGDGAEGEKPRRAFERRSGTGRGNDFKRDGAGRGNWGTPTDETVLVKEEIEPEKEKTVVEEKPSGEQEAEIVNKEKPDNEPEEKEPEEKEMTLEEYEKVLEEKRKALLSNKQEERKVNVDKELQSMKQIANKKANDEFFAKLGADKEKRKESAEKEEKVKKAVNITEFLKPAEGERSSYRGRSRGRGPRGGGFNGSTQSSRPVPLANIEDPGHFPALGAK